MWFLVIYFGNFVGLVVVVVDLYSYCGNLMLGLLNIFVIILVSYNVSGKRMMCGVRKFSFIFMGFVLGSF